MSSIHTKNLVRGNLSSVPPCNRFFSKSATNTRVSKTKTYSNYALLNQLLDNYHAGIQRRKKIIAALPFYLQQTLLIGQHGKIIEDDRESCLHRVIEIYNYIIKHSILSSDSVLYFAARLVQLNAFFFTATNKLLIPLNRSNPVDTDHIIELTPCLIKDLLKILPNRYDKNILYKNIVEMTKIEEQAQNSQIRFMPKSK